jgi:type II secretion system protein N
MAIQLPQVNLGPRTRKIVRYVGFTLLAIVVFIIALQLSFPYDRVKDKVIETAADKYEITIGKVERGIMPGRVYFKAVSIRTRQTKPDEIVNTFYIDKLELDVGILSLLGGTIRLDFDATIGRGDISGRIAVKKFGKGDVIANVTGGSLSADALPMRALLGLPMSGKLEFGIAMNLPMEKSKLGKVGINWQKVKGTINLACPTGCTFGDGKTKLKPLVKNARNQAMVGDGIDFGKVNLDKLVAKVTINKGLLKVERFDAPSKDGEVHIDYEMKLDKNFDDSMVTGCLRFKGSDDLMRREPKTHAALSTTGAELRSDGLFHIRLTDRFGNMKRLNQECGPNASPAGSDGRGDRNGRPNLTVMPDEVAKPVGSATAPTAPPPPPPTPEPPPAVPPTVGHDAGATGSAQPNGSAQPPGTSFEPTTGGRGDMQGHTPENRNAEGHQVEGSAAPATPPPE